MVTLNARKVIFCSKFVIKTLPYTVENADTGSLKSLHALFDTYLVHMVTKFDTYLDHMQTKFEPNRMVQNVQNFEF